MRTLPLSSVHCSFGKRLYQKHRRSFVHDGGGDNWAQPRVGYDYVNNTVFCAVGGSKFPTVTQLTEKMDNSVSGFNVYHTLSVVNEFGKAFEIHSSAFHPQRIYLNTRTDKSIGYRFTDYSTAPVANQNAATFTVEIIDPRSGTTGDATTVRYANGSVQHFKIANGKYESVSLPADYTDHLSAKYQEILNATSRANASLQRAQQIEREYLFKACNGRSSIDGLDNATYTKICIWRDPFEEPYSIASANYQKQLESLSQQAATVEQQR
jgi:hypothetical protein